MSKLVIRCFSISFDGYSAGPDQSLENPLGVGAMQVFKWQFATEAQHKMMAKPGGETGMDNDLVNRGFENVGAWILGRNMFGPVRGPWPDDSWKGWWGVNPPYHVPVFVLTHHARAPIAMEGGTTFHFVTDGIHSALQQAVDAAKGKDVRLGGGTSTIQQYLRAGLVDDMHLVSSPVLIGRGESIFRDLDLPALGYELTSHIASPNATHMFLEKKVEKTK
jgi:dihydrofolate reductase